MDEAEAAYTRARREFWASGARPRFTEVEGRYLSRYGESVLPLGYIDNDSAFRDENPGENGERWALDFTTRAAFAGTRCSTQTTWW